MQHRFYIALALICLAPLAVAQSTNDDLPNWHPLHSERVADDRVAPQPTTSETFFHRLSNVYTVLDEGKPDEALELLQRIRPRRISNYEQAQLHRTYGFVYLQLKRDDEAFAAFQKCVELDALPTPTHQSIVYSLVGYYAGEERYDESNAALLQWFRYESNPSAESYVVLGANYAKQDLMKEALPYVVRANQLADEPNSNWRDIQLAIHVDLGQLDAAIELVRDNIGIWPETVRNYVVLSGLYTETGREQSALATLSIAWHRGLLESKADILELVRLNLILDAPARAGTILKDAMQQGWVKENADNLRLLLDSWTLARENNQAVEVIDQLAKMAADGNYYYRKALLLNETHDWAQVVESCKLAIEKGKLDEPGAVWLLQGIALIELGKLDEAEAAFRNAERTENENVRRDASAWIGYVEDRIRDSS